MLGTRRVDRGSCPPRPPTDPDVRDSRIRLFGSWIRCEPPLTPFTGLRPAPLSSGVTLIRLRARCPHCISLQSLHVPVPPSLHRVRTGAFPCFTGSTRHSDSLTTFPPGFVAFASAVPPPPVVRSQREAGAHLPQAWAGNRMPTGSLSWNRQGLPGSWVALVCACPAL
jgi:hypothetical protein